MQAQTKNPGENAIPLNLPTWFYWAIVTIHQAFNIQLLKCQPHAARVFGFLGRGNWYHKAKASRSAKVSSRTLELRHLM